MIIDSYKTENIPAKTMGAISVADRLGFFGAAFALIVGIALLMTLGAVGYKSVLRGGAESDGARAALSYIRTQVKSHDYEGGVTLRDGMLVLNEVSGEDRYELRIYTCDGCLMEEYTQAEAASAAESSVKLTESDRFKAEYIKSDLLRIETEQGEEYIKLFAAKAEDMA